MTERASKPCFINYAVFKNEMVVTEPEELKGILKSAKVVAVVGCSRDPEKDAHSVPAFLQQRGYRIIPVNPFADEILEEKAYKLISDVKEKVDIVEVFRPSEDVLEVVKEAIKIKPKVIWMQLGIINEEAAKLAEKNGIKVVMDHCMRIECKKLLT